MKNETENKNYWERDPEWVIAPDNPGYRMKTVYYGKVKIEILRPILDEAERKKREAQVVRGLEATLRAYYRRKAELESCQTESQSN